MLDVTNNYTISPITKLPTWHITDQFLRYGQPEFRPLSLIRAYVQKQKNIKTFENFLEMGGKVR